MTKWEAPEWWEPMTHLSGYTNGNHQRAATRIAETCAIAGVEPGDVIAEFAKNYEALKFTYGWHNPVMVLKRGPLMIAIANAKRNGSTVSQFTPDYYKKEQELYG